MSAKTRVKLNFPSPSLEKKEAKSVSTLTYGKMAGLAKLGREVSLFIIITTGKLAGSDCNSPKNLNPGEWGPHQLKPRGSPGFWGLDLSNKIATN